MLEGINTISDLENFDKDCQPLLISLLIKRGVIETLSVFLDGEQAFRDIVPNKTLDFYLIIVRLEDLIKKIEEEVPSSKLTLCLKNQQEELFVALN